MEAESIGSSIGSFSSEFSFADTISYSPPLDISGLDGGSFQPNFSFRNTLELFSTVDNSGSCQSPAPASVTPEKNNIEIPEVFEIGLAESNLDPDIQDSEIPQVYYDAFKEDNLLEPQSFSESINVLDLTVIEPQIDNIEQINTSSEPKIVEIEAKIITQTPVIPSDPDQIGRVWESTQLVEDCRVADAPRNDNLVILSKQPAVEQALVKAGTKPEIVGKVEEEELEEDEKKEKKKKKQLKFVVDEKALSVRQDALKNALEKTPVEIKDGRKVIDSNKVAALMPTEFERPSVKSGILPQYEIELFGFELGDGSHRETVEAIKGMGLRSREEFYQEGYSIIRKLPPVVLAKDGKEVGKKDIDRVFTFKPDPIRHLRKKIIYNN